jgi:hypothetical protein
VVLPLPPIPRSGRGKEVPRRCPPLPWRPGTTSSYTKPQSKEEEPRPTDELDKRREKVAMAEARNSDRLDKANRKDAELIGKYLPPSALSLCREVVQGPDDFFVPPSWLLSAVSEVAATEVTVPVSPTARFDVSIESLDFNSRLIESYGNDFEALLANQEGTTMSYGAKFRPPSQLEKVLGPHPNFGFFSNILKGGMPYHFTRELLEEERLKELELQLARGNHKSAKEKSAIAAGLLLKDVLHGFSLPVRADIVPSIKGAMVEPCGITSQFKLQPDRSRKRADRLTQDLSYSMSSNDASVNSQIKLEDYAEMIYGWCLSRVVHYIVALRAAYPQQRIFISKYNYSDAYRRVHHAASAAVQSIIVIGEIAYIALRLTFGGSPTNLVRVLGNGDRPF